MTYEEFLEINKRYRVICDWDDDLEVCNKESTFIPCWDNRGMLYWIDENRLGLILFSSPYNAVEEFKEKHNIELECFGEKSNYFLEVKDDMVEKVLQVFKAKKQAQRPVPPHSIRNITTFLRVMQNIHERYKEKLDKFIEERREIK